MLPTAIGTLALLLRLYGLGAKPFWLDEVASFYRTTGSLAHLVDSALTHKHYPPYFLLLWLVARFGASQWLLRLPSAIFGAVGAALVCGIGRRAAGPRSGAIAGLLSAFSPFSVHLGQEARPYALVSCLILAALWGLVALAQEPEAAALPLRDRAAPRRAWLAYGLGTAAALNVINVAVSWLIASNLAALALAWQAGESGRRFLRRWGLVQGLILAGWLPALGVLYVVSNGKALEGAAWAPPETMATIWSVVAPVYLHRISKFIVYGLFPAAIPGLGPVIVALALLGAWRLRRDARMLSILASTALLPPIGLLLLSLAVPVLVPRYFAWSAGPFFVLAGTGLGGLAGLRFAVPAAALTAACFVNLAPYYSYETKPRWDLLAARLAREARPGDVVLLNGYYAKYMLSYMLSAFAARAGLDRRDLVLTSQPQRAERLAADHDVWAVYGRVGQNAMEPASAYLRSLDALGEPAAEQHVGRYIVVWRFDARAASQPDEESPRPPALPPR